MHIYSIFHVRPADHSHGDVLAPASLAEALCHWDLCHQPSFDTHWPHDVVLRRQNSCAVECGSRENRGLPWRRSVGSEKGVSGLQSFADQEAL